MFHRYQTRNSPSRRFSRLMSVRYSGRFSLSCYEHTSRSLNAQKKKIHVSHWILDICIFNIPKQNSFEHLFFPLRYKRYCKKKKFPPLLSIFGLGWAVGLSPIVTRGTWDDRRNSPVGVFVSPSLGPKFKNSRN